MKPVTIYTTNYCPYCTRAKNLLRSKSVPFEEIDLTGRDDLRAKVQEKTGWMTVPVILIGEEVIGGYDDLAALEASGGLDAKLQ